MKHMWSENGKNSGTKTLLMAAGSVVLIKFAFAGDPEMVTAVGTSGAALLAALGALYGARRWTDSNAPPR